MSKKKHPRASSNTEPAHMNISQQEEYLSRSSKKKKNILFKLASELSQSPDKGKVRKVYGKESKKAKQKAGNNLYKAIPGFVGDWSGNRMNTEATDDNSLNSGRNRAKSKPVVIYNDINEVQTITLDENKTPENKGNRTITNEFDYYNKSRNDDAITCKRDCSKYTNLSDGNINKDKVNSESQGKGRAIYLQPKTNENCFYDPNRPQMTDKGVYSKDKTDFSAYFDKVAMPLEEIARSNPSLIPLLKLVRRGYEDACQKILYEERIRTGEQDNRFLKENTAKLIDAQDNAQKFKQDLTVAKTENKKILKEKETLEREAARNYNLYKKSKEENEKLQFQLKTLKEEQKETNSKISKLKDYESKFKKANLENKDLKSRLDQIAREYKRWQEEQKEHFEAESTTNGDKVDLDHIGITSDEFRSERNKKYVRGVDCKGHPLVPKLDFEKIFLWREQQDLDDNDDEEFDEEEEEEELLTENEKFMPKGSELETGASKTRKDELENRKEEVIAILNKTYADEEQEVELEMDSLNENAW